MPLESAAEQVASLASQGVGSDGWAQLSKDFNTCDAMASTQDLSILFSDLMGNVQGTIQYNNEHSGVMNVTDICTYMLADADPYIAFVNLQAAYLSANGYSCEAASWATTTAYLASTAKDSTNAGRPWTYQTCNEFGYFQTADSENQPFHSWNATLGLDFYKSLCTAAFDGWTSDPQTAWVNQQYGDVHIDVTNVMFSSGTIDPWHALGVTNYTATLAQKTSVPVYIEGTAHCNDLYAVASSDPATLTYARQVISDAVDLWLN